MPSTASANKNYRGGKKEGERENERGRKKRRKERERGRGKEGEGKLSKFCAYSGNVHASDSGSTHCSGCVVNGISAKTAC